MTMHIHAANWNDFEKAHVIPLKETLTDSDFYALSPDLLTAIGRSVYLLCQCEPKLLKNGTYYEFGIFKGCPLLFAQKLISKFAGKEFKFYGFDSFEGMPESSIDYVGGYCSPGAYAVSLEEVVACMSEHGADWSRIKLIQGWISEKFLRKYLALFIKRPPTILVIDTDIYEPCRDILNSMGPVLLPGTIILFDNFRINPRDEHGGPNAHEDRKALLEYLSENDTIKLMYLFPFNSNAAAADANGAAFLVIANNGEELDRNTLLKIKKVNGTPSLIPNAWPEDFLNIN